LTALTIRLLVVLIAVSRIFVTGVWCNFPYPSP
jgi:hypothetical protein